jgi:hypothetical protein
MRFLAIVMVVAVVVLVMALVPPSPIRRQPLTPRETSVPAVTEIGRVVTAGHGGLVLSDAAGVEHRFPVYDLAHISLNGQLATLEDIERGMSVRVAVRRDGEVMAIHTVDIPPPEDGPHPLWPRERW